jgi:simple sugar transport system substrate-binding protein
MRRALLLVLSLLIVVAAGNLFAEGQQEELTDQMESAQPAEGYTYYVVTHGGPGDPWWGGVFNNGIEAAQEYYQNTEVHWLGPAKYDVQKQVDMLNTAISEDPDGIVLTVPNANAFREPISRIHEEGIPLITINVVQGDYQYLTYVGQQEYEVGYACGERMLQEMGNDLQNAVVLIHQVGHAGLEARAQGFTDATADANVQVEKLAGKTNQSENYQALEAYLTKNPDTDAIFTLGPVGAHPTLKLLNDREWNDEYALASTDTSTQMLNAIEDGRMMFASGQQAWLQGFLPIGFLNLYNMYGLIPQGEVLTGPSFITQDNVDLVRDMIEKGIR